MFKITYCLYIAHRTVIFSAGRLCKDYMCNKQLKKNYALDFANKDNGISQFIFCIFWKKHLFTVLFYFLLQLHTKK